MSEPATLTLRRADGHALTATLFAPAPHVSAADCFVQINPALAVPRQFYFRFALFLAAQGCHALVFDYAGFGDSRDGHWRDSPALLEQLATLDMATVIDAVREKFPGLRHVVVGHSAGGALLGLAPNVEKIDALLAVAAPSAWIGHYAWHAQPALRFFWHVAIPLGTRMAGYFPGQYFGTGPMPAGVARQWRQWALNPHYVSTPEGEPWHTPYARFQGPARFLQFSDDRLYAPLPSVQQIAAYYCNAPRQIVRVRPRDYGVKKIGHFGFFRRGMPESAWQNAVDWLRDPHCAGG